MSDPILPQASLFLGIIPALLLLYISLKGYDEYYQDKNIYLSFVSGLITGFLSALFELYTIGIGILFIILFPIFEQLFKTIILNIRRLQNQPATPIYGLTLGLGFGAIFVPFSIISSTATLDTFSLLLVLIGSFGIILMHAATGVLLGFGIFLSQLPKYYLYAILLHMPITLFIFLTLQFNIGYLQTGTILYGLIIYWYTTTKVMPQLKTKTPPKKRKIRKRTTKTPKKES